MIGRLAGKLLSKQPPGLILDVNGVGYEIEAPMSTFYKLAELGEETVLLIHTHVREDAIQLYGFASEAERTLFRTLIKVSGIGAKLALTILSGIEVDTFVHYVQNEDSDALTQLPGVGKKTAQRLVVEMKDKLEQSSVLAVNAGGLVQHETSNNPIEEAVGALIALGYKPAEASKMVSSVPQVNDIQNVENIIRQALKGSVQ